MQFLKFPLNPTQLPIARRKKPNHKFEVIYDKEKCMSWNEMSLIRKENNY